MARVKRGNVSRKRHKKILKATKGFRGSLSKLFRPAHQAYLHAMTNKYRDRRLKKRQFRALWIMRLSAAVRAHQLSYSVFINKMKDKEVAINRKCLSELAISYPKAFSDIVTFVSPESQVKKQENAPKAPKTEVKEDKQEKAAETPKAEAKEEQQEKAQEETKEK